jgi:hypothetical protein
MWTRGARRLNIRVLREAEEISTIIQNQHNGAAFTDLSTVIGFQVEEDGLP